MFSYIINEVITQEDSCSHLGSIIVKDLNWGKPVGNMVNKVYRALNFVMRVMDRSSRKASKLVYKLLMRPILEYEASVWGSYQIELVIVGNSAAKGCKMYFG